MKGLHMNTRKENKFSLHQRHGKYFLRFENTDRETPVKVKLARPLTGRNSEISFIDEKKKEVAMVKRLTDLDPDSRKVASEALDLTYLITRITRVDRTRTHFGTRFWEVETDRGARHFAMKDPSHSVSHFDDGRMVLWDTMGNCYEIESFEHLDEHSQKQVEKIV